MTRCRCVHIVAFTLALAPVLALAAASDLAPGPNPALQAGVKLLQEFVRFFLGPYAVFMSVIGLAVAFYAVALAPQTSFLRSGSNAVMYALLIAELPLVISVFVGYAH